ncbi:cytochrome ubiquinol oxidase subunit I [Francisella adeliensis]|uniref:Cytochrome ubiquinol oxidase subunit I n=1 Tax=Francisella adeliensis TaxID=2007306 RepID=A0A2Z4XXR1_9GAMM|nr:cytochrome ubiquinol oxidase subunit I [Francisella adeliensis]AXA33242.1 cytochrome ubiquinol oxidase subunit I [Francisella adeliensis]MBK2085037.1 cytochrome ubiquinol oxidase subunit I [Francisella adeliensis]MBK2096972.1 cytochrome ubiquinol oxidase subunit I [Francisella adeliensis]QIW11468.1 cytochrome ubiquinol oxidase subunit I [Francisella adeliensis]QIW13343.1 cytochrome ubiquinol oxidase subunit I [Francisella adeliensis]
MDWVEILSRIQFAFTVSFHILFPAFSIGLSTFLMIFEALWLITKKEKYLLIVKFWTKVFALTFGMGVVSGIVMEFQLGANWAGFAKTVGPVLGSLFTYEVLTAFFIEAGALGIMIFGWGRINKYIHFSANFVIFVGVTLSAFWILSANSWMQTPDGVNFVNGQFEVYSWYHVIFNPSVIPRFIHMLIASYLSTLMVILGVSCYYMLIDKFHLFAKTCIKFSLLTMLFLSFAQLFVGDEVGIEVHKHQPLKTAAMEGVWDTQKGAPLVLFAYPSENQEKNLFAIEIPKLASLVNTHELNGEMLGLKSVAKEDRPLVAVVFYSFRIMVGIGLLMVFIGVVGSLLLAKQRIYGQKWFLWLCRLATPLGFVAIITGWFTAEFGRQPWVVYNLVKTQYSVSDISAWQVALSLGSIFVVYFIIFGYFYFKYLVKLIKAGPGTNGEERMPYSYFQSVEKTSKDKE